VTVNFRANPNNGKMKYPAQQVRMDFPADMLKELNNIATGLNLSRQAVSVAYLRHSP